MGFVPFNLLYHLQNVDQDDIKNGIYFFILSIYFFSLIYFSIFLLQVRDVKLIMDRNSRRSKGVGYVICGYWNLLLAFPQLYDCKLIDF